MKVLEEYDVDGEIKINGSFFPADGDYTKFMWIYLSEKTTQKSSPLQRAAF